MISTLADQRRQIIEALAGERGQRLVLLSWWADALTALDDPQVRELVLLLIRQAGKSQLLMAIAITELMLVRDAYIVLIAASEAQQQALYHRKLRRPLERVLDALGQRKVARFTKRGVEIEHRNAALEILAPTEDTTPGRTVTQLLIDEARYIPDAVYVALAPSVLGAGGKIVIASTAGPPSGWFYQLVQNPTPESWIYRSDRNENPCADAGVLDFLRRRLSLVSPAAARRELHGEFTEEGEELVAPALIDAAVEDTLGEHQSHTAPAYAFLDLGRKRDLTSLVVVASLPPRRPEAADHVEAVSVRTWDPRHSPTGEVDFAEVREEVGRLPRRFPNLRRLLVDEGAEAGSVLPWARQQAGLALLVEGFVGSVAANQDMWSALVARLNGRTLSIPRHERLLAELRGLRREEFAFGSRWRVVDASRRLHRDVSLALAGAVWAAGSVARCPICGDDACDGEPPLGLLGSPDVVAWFERHPERNLAHNQGIAPTTGERAALLAVFAPLCEALENGDDEAVERAAEALEAHLSDVERTDLGAGVRVRELAARVRGELERRLSATP